MLAHISGTLERIDGHSAIVRLAPLGVSVEALLPTFLAFRLQDAIGNEISLHTRLELEPHGQSGALTPRLIGFESARQRRFFELFTTVKGVGGRRALRAMAEPPERIARAISDKDAPALQRLPEIGKRLAETIIAELHGKVDDYLNDSAPATRRAPETPARSQAVDALVRLGEPRQQAEVKVLRALERDPALDTAEAILAAALSGAPS
jgi:Holliday junction DNA helicase RuvA